MRPSMGAATEGEDRRATGPASSVSTGASPRLLLLTVGIALLFSATGVFDHALWTPDEPRVAEVGREMLVSGDYVVPRLAGEPFLEKPPLHWWTMALAYRLFGVSDGVARLPSTVFALLTVLIAADMARRIAGARAGLLAACVLVTLVSFFEMRRAITDPALSFFVALGYWAFQHVAFPTEDEVRRGRSPTPWFLLVHAAGGLAFLSKGVVGVGLLFGPLVLYAIGSRRWALFRSRAHLWGLGLLTLLCAAWPLALAVRGDGMLRVFLVEHVVHRFLPGEGELDHGHKRPFWYYLGALPVLMPWILAWPALLRSIARRRTAATPPPGLAFVALLPLLGTALLSVPGTKRSLYLLPLIAPMAAATGVWLAGLQGAGREDPWARTTLRVLAGTALLLLVVEAIAGLVVLVGPDVGGELGARVFDDTRAPLFGALLCLSATAVVVALVRHLRREGATVRGVTAAFCGVWLAVNLFGLRLADPAKDLRPFVDELVSTGTFDSPVLGFRFDETTQAILPFYGGHEVPSFDDSDALEDRLAESPGARVLMLERHRGALSPRLQERLSVLQRWTMSGRRVYALYGVADAPDRGPDAAPARR